MRSRLPIPILAAALAGAAPAYAGFEGQGAPIPPSDGAPDDPTLSWSARPLPKGTGVVDASVDYADAPLFRRTESGAEVTELGDVISLRAAGRYALTDRVDVAVLAPIVLSYRSEVYRDAASPALGDARLAGRVRLTGSPSPVHVALIPELRLPTGAASVNLGDDGVGASTLVAVSASPGVLRLGANLGASWRTFQATANVQPGPGLLGSVAVGVAPSEAWAVQAEARYVQRLVGTDVDGEPAGFVRVPRGAEYGVSAKGKVSGTVWLGGALLTGAPWGFSAARFRGMITVGARFGKDPEAAEARREAREARRAEARAVAPVPVVVRVQDESGVPLDATLRVDGASEVQATSGRARLSLPPGEHRVDIAVDGFGPQARELDLVAGLTTPEEVRVILLPTAGDGSVYVDLGSPEDTPIDNATLSIDGRPVGESGSGGGVLVSGLGPDSITLEARAEAFRPRTVQLDPSADPERVDLLLARERGAVQLVVTTPEGRPVPDARARFIGPDRLGPYNLGELGSRTFVLRPGAWQVLVSHPNHGLQQRGLDLLDEDTELAQVRFVLQPPETGGAELDLRVVDPTGAPVSDAAVTLDGVPLGRTSTAGSLRLADLGPGPRTVAVSGPDLQPVRATLDLYPGLQEHVLVTRWEPGATLLRARGPDGMAPDARVRGQGPAPLTALDLGKDGVTRTRLAPGDWTLLFSSARLGLTQQSAAIPAEAGRLTVVDALLGERDGVLDLRVVDPESRPVPEAVVRLDGQVVGRTTPSGTLAVPAGAGTHAVQVQARPFAPTEQRVRVAGEQTVEQLTLGWGPGAVRVRVRNGGAPVPTARVRLGGPRFVPPTPVDDDGQRLFALDPGTWQVLVSAPDLGLEQVTLQVPERPQLTDIVVDLDPIDPNAAQAIVRVQSPDGRPIPQAKVQLDDRAPVPAPGGFAAFTDVDDGAHRISITAPDFEPVVVDGVSVKPGTSQRIVPLARTPRRLDVRVLGPDGAPLPDARVLAIAPESLPAAQTGPDGTAALELDRRAWELLVRAEGLRVARIDAPAGASTDPLQVRLGPARVQVEGARLVTAEPIYFPTGKATLGAESRDLLDEVADTLVAHPELVQVQIGGHTDATGGVAVNMRLSRQRAQAVVDALVERGVAPERLSAEGYGPTRPTASNDTPEGRAMNRRVEFVGAGE